jgi:hypothetical protein
MILVRNEIVLLHLEALPGAAEEAGTRLLAPSWVDAEGRFHNVEIVSWPFNRWEAANYRILRVQATKDIPLPARTGLL